VWHGPRLLARCAADGRQLAEGLADAA